ncbi:hypothetical protein LCGC14_1932830, partial [marine sediment metagenome]
SNCYHTNWITAVVLGHNAKAYDYDISGAYPFQTSKLLSCSLTDGVWKQSGLYQKDADYGFCYVQVSQHSYLSPLMFRASCIPGPYGSRVIKQNNSVGEWTGWLTKDEIDFVRSNLGHVEILDGWWFFSRTESHPFEIPMRSFYESRLRAIDMGDRFASTLCKLVAVAAQGKFISSFPVYGQLAASYMKNAVYAAIVTSSTRLQVAEFCLQHEGNVLNIAVDGVTLDKKVDVPGGWGNFRLESSSEGEECIIAGDGEYWMPSRNSIFQRSTLEEFAESKSYEDLSIQGRHTLLEVSADRIYFDEVGKFRDKRHRSILNNVVGAQRVFTISPSVCADLLTNQYESLPRVI